MSTPPGDGYRDINDYLSNDIAMRHISGGEEPARRIAL